MLMSMWRMSIEDPSQCMIRFHATDSMVQLLASMTLNQVKHAASVSDCLFMPRFDAEKLKQLAGDKDSGSTPIPTSEMQAMVYATVPPRKR